MLEASVDLISIHISLGVLESGNVLLDIHAVIDIEWGNSWSWHSEASLLEKCRANSSSLYKNKTVTDVNNHLPVD